MRMAKFVPAVVCVAVMCVGCSTRPRTHFAQRQWQTPEPVAVTVRFVAPPEAGAFASTDFASGESRLVRGGKGTMVGGGFTADSPDVPAPAHVVIWGGPYNGQEVTYRPARLTSGPYTFGMFDPNAGAAYQGWLDVNDGGNDIVGVLNEWRETVREQQQWLGFEYQLRGKFESKDPRWFNRFTREIDNLRSLETKIQNAVAAELNFQRSRRTQWNEILSNSEVLLMPGQGGFFAPSTKPAFNEEEIAELQNGEALTKVILVGNFEQSHEKLNRTLDLQEDLYRSRSVLEEEAQRLQNRANWYRLTDHLYRFDGRLWDNNDKWFVENQRRLQQVRGLIAKVDRQIDDYRRYCHALLFVTGLFAPDETFDAFEQQKAALARQRIVLNERKRQLDRKFQNASESSNRRVFLERQRQNVLAEIDNIDYQMGQIQDTQLAVNNLRQNTDVIHRHGPARVLAATFVSDDVPALFVNAVERESLMTVRVQAADDMFVPGRSITKVRSTSFDSGVWNGPSFVEEPCKD